MWPDGISTGSPILVMSYISTEFEFVPLRTSLKNLVTVNLIFSCTISHPNRVTHDVRLLWKTDVLNKLRKFEGNEIFKEIWSKQNFQAMVQLRVWVSCQGGSQHEKIMKTRDAKPQGLYCFGVFEDLWWNTIEKCLNWLPKRVFAMTYCMFVSLILYM